MITTFTPATLRPLRDELEAAMKAVATKHGITIELGKMTYDHTGMTFTAPLKAATSTKAPATAKQAIALAKSILGVDASAPSEHVRTKGAVLTDFRPKSPARPWVYEQDGKTYVTTDASAKMMWPVFAADAPDLA